MSPPLVIERVYNHPIERVWGAIIDPASVRRWLGLTGFQPTVGNVFTVSVPQDVEQTVVGEVLEVDEPGLIRMFWRGGSVNSQVCIELEEVAGATRLRMTQREIGPADQGALASIWAPLWGSMLDEGLPSVLSSAVVAPAVVAGAGGSPAVVVAIVAIVALLGLGSALCVAGAAGGWSGSDVARSLGIDAQPGDDAGSPEGSRILRGAKATSSSLKDSSHGDFDSSTSTSSGPQGVQRGPVSAGLDFFDQALPTTMNPLFARTMVDTRSHELVFDRLYTRSAFNDEMQSRVVDTDAIIDEGMALRITLREGVKWHDGRPLTARDVCFTVRAMLDTGTASTFAEPFRQSLRGCAVQDVNTAVITFTKRYPTPRRRASFPIVPAHAFGGSTALNPSDRFSARPVGTGPYKALRGRRSVSYTAVNNAHHNAGIATFNQHQGGDPFVQIRTLINGGVHGVVSIAPSMRPEVSSSEVASLRRYDLRSWWFIAVNTRSRPFADRRVRQALDLSLDRQELRKYTIGVDKDDADPPCQFISGPFVPSSPFTNREVPVRASHDRQLAAQRLTQAGASRVAGAWHLDGRPIVARLGMYAALESEAVDLLNQVGDQLRSTGVEVRLSKVSADDWDANVVTGRAAGDYDLLLGKWSFGVVEDVGPLFHTREGVRGQLNIFNYSDPQIDLLLQRYDGAKTDVEAVSAYRDLHAALSSELPYLFLWKLDTMSAWRDEVQGVQIAPYFYFTQVDGWR